MEITFDKHHPGYDHVLARADGTVFGFRALDDGSRICVTRCALCNRENYAPAVITGECCWCGWNPNELDSGVQT